MTPEKRLAEEELTGGEAKKLKEDLSPITEEKSDTEITKDENNGKVTEEESKTEEETEENVATETDEELFDSTGSLLLAGCVQWNLIGRRNQKAIPALQHFAPRRIKNFADQKIGFVCSHSSAAHSIIITDKGKVWMLGRNEKGQLGCGDTEDHTGPVEVEFFKDMTVVSGAVGRNHSLFLTSDGEVYGCGENKQGQCGVGNNTAILTTPTKVDFKEAKVVKIACGAEFSMLIDTRGYLFSFGCPEYGQLGHNTDGKYFVSSNKISYQFETSPRRIPVFVECAKGGHPTPISNVQIVSVSCGNNHTVAIDSKKRAYTWGFGGYGRLGHSEPKDEMIPRLIKFFDGHNRGVLQCYSGATFTIANTELGIYLWGQTKRTGEANMYPKPIQDLYGWNVRAIGCSMTSIVIAADDTVIAWGPSPTYGELGLGENTKSSTTPKECKALDGVTIHKVSCGMGHTLYVARGDTEEDRSLLGKLKEISL